MSPLHLWLRDETKPGEERAPLTPAGARRLLDAGARVTVERSKHRVFRDSEYLAGAPGVQLTESGTWRNAPADAVIFGIKELPAPTDEADRPLRHRHLLFAHAFKEQKGWRDVLSRFVQGGGVLYDLEYLKRADGRRVAAFGYWAGYVGAGVGLLAWTYARRHRGEPMPALRAWRSQAALVAACKDALALVPLPSVTPRAIVLGARGRSGSGAVALLEAVGAPVTAWDLEETRAGGPFDAILAHDLFVNAVLVAGAMPPFVTRDQIGRADEAGTRRLGVVSDVSCDPHSPHNPVPIYSDTTTLERPTVRVIDTGNPLDVVAIDHLPSLLPRESSEDFAEQLLPHLLELHTHGDSAPVWSGAAAVFADKIATLPRP